jgi:hypothetical protein
MQHLPGAAVSIDVKDEDYLTARIDLAGKLFLSLEVIFTTGLRINENPRTGWLLEHVVEHINTLPHDTVVLLNMGHWINDPGHLVNVTRPLVEALDARHTATNGATLAIWRSSNAQHFNILDGSYYFQKTPAHPLALPTPNPNVCVELNETAALNGNWREPALEPLLRNSTFGLSIPFFEITIPWWRNHYSYSEAEERAAARPRKRAHMVLSRIPDCTHMCLGGASQHWLPVWAALEESVRQSGKVHL